MSKENWPVVGIVNKSSGSAKTGICLTNCKCFGPWNQTWNYLNFLFVLQLLLKRGISYGERNSNAKTQCVNKNFLTNQIRVICMLIENVLS
jgi:hypothetical protein